MPFEMEFTPFGSPINPHRPEVASPKSGHPLSNLGHWMARRNLLLELGLWHSSSDPVSNSLDTGWPGRKSLLNQVLRSWRSSGVPVSKGVGGSA